MSETSHKQRQSARQLRERKHKKLYTDDWTLASADDADVDDLLDGDDGRRTFNLHDKLTADGFASHQLVREIHGADLTVTHLQRHGFHTPLLVRERAGLGLRVPTANFTVNDVRTCVGSKRRLDVMDVATQKNTEMLMRDWQRYYESPRRDRLLNVISLEFSHTKLEHYVQSPTIVRQIDWVDAVWPRHLKASQTEATNRLDDMKYPKVQKYCLMSVKGCYTDFHIDFGGTSVWYHILRGSKVFWLIPPTEHNIVLFERWVLSGKQSHIFFGDTVDQCQRIHLVQGNTFFIPSGWIHAVYTPCDSLVFGGNFLHSHGIDKQLRVAQMEETTKVPQKFRYPFFSDMLWYVLERYVYHLLGKSHLNTKDEEELDEQQQDKELESLASRNGTQPHLHLTPGELHGLREIVMYLHTLPPSKKTLPKQIRDPINLIKDVRTVICLHRSDSDVLAVTGKPILIVPPEGADVKPATIPTTTTTHNHHHHNNNSAKLNNNYNNSTSSSDRRTSTTNVDVKPTPVIITPPPPPLSTSPPMKRPPKPGPSPPSEGPSGKGGSGGGPRRRRTRCKKCEACQRSDCGECSFCLDMVKFGGPGRAKQTCNMRQCLQPMLPVTAACAHCGLDGWNQTPVTPLQKGVHRCESASNLMECSVCYEIAHPVCIQRLCVDFTGYTNEDMPNSWECPQCCKLGRNTDYRPRHFRARQKSGDMRRMSVSSDASSAPVQPPPLPVSLPPPPLTMTSQPQSSVQFEATTPISTATKRTLAPPDASSRSTTHVSDELSTGVAAALVPIKKRRSSEQPNESGRRHTTSKSKSSGAAAAVEAAKVTSPPPSARKAAFRLHLAQQIISGTVRNLKKASVVVRPAPPINNISQTVHSTLSAANSNANSTNHNNNNNNSINNNGNNGSSGSLYLDKRCLLPIFKHLSPMELVKCALVCKTWATLTVDPSLWRRMCFNRRLIQVEMLKGIVRRQPETLHLDWCHVNKFQLPWLFQRLPMLKHLSLVSVNARTAVSLRTTFSAHLVALDLSYIQDFNDSCVREILGPTNNDTRRGLGDDNRTRFRNLKHLQLAGTDITDISMRYVTQYVPAVQHLGLSLCARISDAGVAQLSTKPATTVTTLLTLDLSHTKLVTEASLEHLQKCESLVRLDCRHAQQISTQALIRFAARSDRNLHVKDIKLVERRE